MTFAMLDAALVGLAAIAGLALLTWVVSLMRNDVSLVDRMWGVFIAGAALTYYVELRATGARAGWMLALVIAWAVRLCVYITSRNWGHGEDRRYREMRARNQPNFDLKSMYLVFGLQTVIAWIVSAPFLVGMSFVGMSGTDKSTAPALGVLDQIGIAIAVFGIAFEAIGDAQMARFKSDPGHEGQVMDRGLWRYTRHPNYFGEACTWWGLWLLAISGAGFSGAWSVVSPVLMTVLLLKVSGVSLLEKDISERRPGYREYIERTAAFVPWRPRR
jgi:steroid 5-alpha reductase family enzyme